MAMRSNHTETIRLIAQLFVEHGATRYESGAPNGVSQLEHALQCAALAEHAGADPELVAAALLHDLGHLLIDEDEAAAGEDDLHQFRAIPLLRETFAQGVLEPIKLHVDAKRYLCAVESAYYDALSPASQYSLSLQGGPFDAEEAAAFIARPFAREAVLLRRWDDAAKMKGRETPALDHFLFILRHAIKDSLEMV